MRIGDIVTYYGRPAVVLGFIGRQLLVDFGDGQPTARFLQDLHLVSPAPKKAPELPHLTTI